MKVLITIAIIVETILCEVPPPYPARGFRPSPPFNLPAQFSSSQIRQPQRTYGPPNIIPPKITAPSAPQTQYGVPNNAPNIAPSLNSNQRIPGTSYGVPITDSRGSSKNNPRIVNNQVQNRPQALYGAPDTRNIETLEQIRQLNLLLQSRKVSQAIHGNQFPPAFSQSQNSNRNIAPNSQYLPQREPSNFRTSDEQLRNADSNFLQPPNSNRNTEQPNVQYLPSREVAQFQLTEFSAPNQNSIQNSNIQQLTRSQQFLPVKEATNFKQGFALQEPDIPQRININIPNTNFGLPNRETSNVQNTAIPIQYPPLQSQTDDTNNPAISTQYVPSERPVVSGVRPSTFNNNQQTPRPDFDQRQIPNINNVLPPPNLNSNNFEQQNVQNNFDIQQADVRKLEPGNRNRNVNRFETPAQNLGSTIRPVEPNKSFGGVKSRVTSGKPIGQAYLVPTTTAKSINRQLTRPSFASTTTEAPLDDQNESAEPDAEAGGPNIAVATAVSGVPGGQDFYLLQPDGRLQRVVYQKIREIGDQENEYTANYLFQNIQPDPNLVYSPLITLGK